MLDFHEACSRHVAAPRLKVVVSAVAPVIPTFLVLAVRIGTEQYPRRLQCGVQLLQHARQFLGRYMKERSVREDAIKVLARQVKPVEILVPHLTPSVGTRHGGKTGRALQTYSRVP